MSDIKLPEVPARIFAMAGIWNDDELNEYIRAYAEQAVRQALAEYVPVACCVATSQGVLHEFSPMRDAERVARMARKLRQKLVHLYVIPENNHAEGADQ